MTEIVDLAAIEILDSRGNPTLRVEARLANGIRGAACVPSGASCGSREALELRDGDPKRYRGKGVLGGIAHVEGQIGTLLRGVDAAQQREIDDAMCAADGSPLKEHLGANAILGVSLAVAHAAARDNGLPLYEYIARLSGERSFSLPLPMMNIVNGGAHADNNLDFQEFMVQPLAADTFTEALRWGAEIFHALVAALKQRGLATAVGDEGGVAPNLPSHAAALDIVLEAVRDAGFEPGRDIGLALDCAASEFYSDGRYHLQGEGRTLDAEELVDYLVELTRNYPITSLEDCLAEDDWAGWAALSQVLGERLQLVGDDLFVTDCKTLQRGIDAGVANAVLVKLNQVGTLSETLDLIALAQRSGYGTVISHRSGETEDTTIADLAVATAAGQIKTGAPCRSDRVAKYNRLLCIERELGASTSYRGGDALARGEV